MPEIEHDTAMTEIWVTENGKRYRAYRGNTKRHIEWKLSHHAHHRPEVIEDITPPPADAAPMTS